MEWALAHKWVIEVLDPELQAQCKSYKDGKKIAPGYNADKKTAASKGIWEHKQ